MTFSASLCGLGITWTLTNSPTLRAAAAPASVAAFTEPPSPRTQPVTNPAPIYSFATRVTLTSLTMETAASTAPTNPLVSIIPKSSLDIVTLSDVAAFRGSTHRDYADAQRQDKKAIIFNRQRQGCYLDKALDTSLECWDEAKGED